MERKIPRENSRYRKGKFSLTNLPPEQEGQETFTVATRFRLKKETEGGANQ